MQMEPQMYADKYKFHICVHLRFTSSFLFSVFLRASVVNPFRFIIHHDPNRLPSIEVNPR